MYNLEAKCKISIFQLECTSSCICNATPRAIEARWRTERRQPCSHSQSARNVRQLIILSRVQMLRARASACGLCARRSVALLAGERVLAAHTLTHTLILGSLAHEHKFRMQNARRWPRAERARSSQPASERRSAINTRISQSTGAGARAFYSLNNKMGGSGGQLRRRGQVRAKAAAALPPPPLPPPPER